MSWQKQPNLLAAVELSVAGLRDVLAASGSLR
jgi:hypothetical protein